MQHSLSTPHNLAKAQRKREQAAHPLDHASWTELITTGGVVRPLHISLSGSPRSHAPACIWVCSTSCNMYRMQELRRFKYKACRARLIGTVAAHAGALACMLGILGVLKVQGSQQSLQARRRSLLARRCNCVAANATAAWPKHPQINNPLPHQPAGTPSQCLHAQSGGEWSPDRSCWLLQARAPRLCTAIMSVSAFSSRAPPFVRAVQFHH